MKRWFAWFTAWLLLLGCASSRAAPAAPTELLIYGGTPAGIAAALAAGREGRTVLLVEPYRWIGGLSTNGLSHTDFRTFEGLNGVFLELTRRVQEYYEAKYGPGSPQARDCFRGTQAEPHVNLLVWRQMLAELSNVQVVTRRRLDGVETTGVGAARRIATVRLVGDDGETLAVRATFFIDASYEGDLMAAAGVEHRVGREARSEYGESLAPETADEQVQGYNFRPVMTRDPALRVALTAPPGYRREDFLPVLPILESGRLKTAFCDSQGGLYKAHLPPLPNGKHDVNDVSRSLVRLSLPDINDAWPAGDAQTRRRIYDEHVQHNFGLLYFLQNDPAVPERFRDEAREWGLCQDEFAETNHVPEQLYVREARRMVGAYVFTERNTDPAPGDARAVLREDAIAMGDYGPNCHGTSHEGPRFGGRHVGEFYKRVPPYQIPYGVLVPQDCANLLVPVACSASHVGFCALRLEPVWAALGQASGYAAHVAMKEGVSAQETPVAAVQRLLHKAGAATIYVSDVPPGSPDFAAVQWWGTLGGLHGLAPQPEQPGQRGAHLISQYYAAYPGHAAELDQPLDAELVARWSRLAAAQGVARGQLANARTRREFIRQAYAAASPPSAPR